MTSGTIDNDKFILEVHPATMVGEGMAPHVGVLVLGPVVVLMVQGTFIPRSARLSYICVVLPGSQTLPARTFVQDVPFPALGVFHSSFTW